MDVKTHYDDHLASFYAWMAGDFDEQVANFSNWLAETPLTLPANAQALDLGAGHGIHTISLAQQGIQVTAVDFSKDLLSELEERATDLPIQTRAGDIRELSEYADLRPDLVLCMGDTLTHLASKNEVEQFLADCGELLPSGASAIFAFRDYTDALSGNARFIPVKSDDTRILTCILDYQDEHVWVTDLLHEKTAKGWQQKVSTYAKVRISPESVINMLQHRGLQLFYREAIRGMHHFIFQKS